MADCRTGAEKEHASLSVHTQHLGSGGSRAGDSARRMEQSQRNEGVRSGKRGSVMKIEVFPGAESVAREAAKLIAEEARTAIAVRAKFVMAVSCRQTPAYTLTHPSHE